MSTPDRDDEFEAFLARRSLLPRALAEHENAEVPPEVDRRVLDAARAAVNSQPARRSFGNRWPVPLALAATVLISLAIVTQIQRPAPEVTASTQTYSAPEESEPAEEFEPEADVLSDSPERFAKASAPAESRALIANEVRRARADELASQASEDSSAQSRREAYAAMPPAPSPVLADAAHATDSAAAEAGDGAADSVPAAAAEGRGAASSVAEAKARSATDSVAGVQAGNGKAASPAAAAQAERDPKAWLEHIAKLRAEGKHAEADREFKAFVKRHPDYVTDETAIAK